MLTDYILSPFTASVCISLSSQLTQTYMKEFAYTFLRYPFEKTESTLPGSHIQFAAFLTRQETEYEMKCYEVFDTVVRNVI